MSAQKAIQGSETETRESLGGSTEIMFPDEGSLICSLGKLMIFLRIFSLLLIACDPPASGKGAADKLPSRKMHCERYLSGPLA